MNKVTSILVLAAALALASPKAMAAPQGAQSQHSAELVKRVEKPTVGKHKKAVQSKKMVRKVTKRKAKVAAPAIGAKAPKKVAAHRRERRANSGKRKIS